MTKPTMKSEVALDTASENYRVIYFYGTPDAADEFREFGHVGPWAYENQYCLTVDARFDFGEVLAHVVNYGKA